MVTKVKEVPKVDIAKKLKEKLEKQEAVHRLHKLLEGLLMLLETVYGPSVKLTNYYSLQQISQKNIKNLAYYVRLNLKMLVHGKIFGLLPIDYFKKIAEISLDGDLCWVFIDISEPYFDSISKIIPLFEEYISSNSVYVKVFPLKSCFRKSGLQEKSVELNDLIPKPILTKNGLNNS